MGRVELLRLKARSGGFARLWRYTIGFYAVWIVQIGRQTGLLENLAREQLSVNQLIYSTRLYPPAVKAWCSAAVSFGLLEEKKGKLHLSPSNRVLLLDSRRAEYLG